MHVLIYTHGDTMSKFTKMREATICLMNVLNSMCFTYILKSETIPPS